VPGTKAQFGDGLIAAQKLFAERSATAAAENACLCGRTTDCCSLVHSGAK
jgi:hypothetical protein